MSVVYEVRKVISVSLLVFGIPLVKAVRNVYPINTISIIESPLLDACSTLARGSESGSILMSLHLLSGGSVHFSFTLAAATANDGILVYRCPG